jgi:hypothetical protein
MVGQAGEHNQEHEAGDHHEEATHAAADDPTKAQTKAKSEAVFD